MYYGIILSTVYAKGTADDDMKAKLRSNLWLALNDVRLLLEPSDTNIQALTLLACHVEEFTTPSLCWMLISNACRMLQALGVNHKSLAPEILERRIFLFWTLNCLDKPLAVMFGRSPTFHRAMSHDIPPPSLQQIISTQGFRSNLATSTLTRSLFGAHFMRQSYIMSKVMADVWCLLYEHNAGGLTAVSVKESLESWHRDTRTVSRAPWMRSFVSDRSSG